MLAMKSVGIMPNHLDTREIFFTNLLLLGFDPVVMESREKIPFNRDMFALPNKKAMEVVMHFLFSKISPQMTYEEFRDCWPVKNKVEEQQFRKTCYNWVSRIAKEEKDAYLPRVVQSLFHSPGGDRFYQFLLLFSSYVLAVVMLRDHSRHVSIPPFPSKSIHNHNFTQAMSKSYQVQTAIHRKRFFELTKYSLEVQQHWKAFAVELTKEQRSLKKKIKELERQLKCEVKCKGELMARSLAINQEYQKETDAIKRTQHLQKVRGLWLGFEEFHLAQGQQRDVVETILEGQANEHHLDASDVVVKIPDLLFREFEQELQMKRIGNTYIGGKLNLLSLVQLWNLSLRLLKEKIRQESVPSFDESSPKIKNDVHTHQSLLSNAETLRLTLSNETIPELKESVEKLKDNIYKEMVLRRGTSGPHPYSFNLGLGLAPATPPVSFTAAETPASHRILSFQDSLRKTPVGVSTPEVVSSWSESLRGRRSQVHTQQSLQRADLIDPSKVTRVEKTSQIPKPKTTVNEKKYQTKRRQGIKGIPQKGLSTSAKKPLTSASNSRLISKTGTVKTKNLTRTEPRTKVSKAKRVDEDFVPSKTSAVTDVANQIIGVMSSDRPNSVSASSSQSSSRASTPKPQAVADPTEALDEAAFVSRDLLMRTPAPKEKDASLPVRSSTAHNHDDTLGHPETKSLDRSGSLLETILNQTSEPLSVAKVKTSLFPPSPEEQVKSPFSKMLQASDSPLFKPAVNDSMFDKDELLVMSPFAFESPTLSRRLVHGEEDKDLELQPELKTPFSFVTPLSNEDSRRTETVAGFSPFYTTLQSASIGPTTEPCGTPTPDKISRTDSIKTTSASSGVMHIDSPLLLSDALEKKLRLNNEKLFNQTRTPSQTISTSAISYSNTTVASSTRRLDEVAESKLSPQISHFETRTEHSGDGGLVPSEDEATTHRLDKKNSSFGGLEIIDDEDTAGREKTPLKELPANESSFKEMKDSDLMSRLNKIKQAQQRYDLIYSSPGHGVSKTDQESPGTRESNASISIGATGAVASETIQARLDHLQEENQVISAAGSPVTLKTSFAGSVSPLTASTKGSPKYLTGEDGSKSPLETSAKGLNRERTGTPSNGSTPTSMLSERFLLKSPFGAENDTDYLNDSPLHRFFTLDSPMASPDVGFTPKLRVPTEDHSFCSPNGTPEHGTTRSGEKYNKFLSKDFNNKQDLSASVDLENRSTLLSKVSDQNGIKDFWMSNHATPKGMTIYGDRRLSYDDFLNESMETSFLVQNTPLLTRASKSSQSTSPAAVNITTPIYTPSYDACEQPETTTPNLIMAARSPAVGQLIDL